MSVEGSDNTFYIQQSSFDILRFDMQSMAMKPFALLVGFVLLITVARCGQSGAANDEHRSDPVALPDTLDIAYRDTLFLADGADWITFDSLAHDSRCPTGATCVWEGNAEVGFALYQDDGRHVFALNTHPNFLNDTTLTALSISLLDLTPYPHVDSTYRSEQYTARVFLSR